MARVLLIEDDAELIDMLGLALEDAGHSVRAERDGKAGLAACLAELPDVVVSDVNMPYLDGFTLTRKIRASGIAVPVLLLTSRDSEVDEALGLELGADDYVAKPFSTRVLLARIDALLRRGRSNERPEAPLASAGLCLWPDRLEVRYRDQNVEVTVTEVRLLECLLRRPGVVLSRDRLLELLREDGSVVQIRIIDTYVRRLRKKLGAIDPSFDRIETIIGAGYRWKDG